MKKIILLLLIFCSLMSCTIVTINDQFNRLKHPIIIIAEDTSGNITLIDSDNRYLTISNTYILGSTLSATYNVGDTVISVKK